ncbi:MAG TPA: acyltransferase family protein [Solirubrobacteraceae bacterium]|nr:acyltransferase family protein [Solirubrobacteraceae bacterium]
MSSRDSGSSGGEHHRFRRDVEGLRAVAILLVVLYHVHAGLAPGGYVGVDVFFVISGFLITGQLVRELRTDGRISFLAFYARRARRILPAALLTVTITAVASALLLNPLAAERSLHDSLSAIYFGANVHFAARGADYFNAGLSPSPIQHFWSLAVEEQFYIAWPLLLVVSSLVWLGVRRQSTREQAQRSLIGAVILVLGILAAISLMASIRQTTTSPSWAYFSIVTRAWELAVGAVVALALPVVARLDRRLAIPLSWVGLACIALAAALFSDITPYPGDSALLPVLGTAAVICGGSALASRRFGAETLLGRSPFQRVGAWSYSWYLWHWPALVLAPAVLGHSLSELQAVAVALVSLVIAVMSFVLLERPLRRVQIIVRRPALGLGAAGGLAAIAIAIVALSGSLAAPLASTAAPVRLAALDNLASPSLGADLIAGAGTIKVPSNLRPTLSGLASANPRIIADGCELGPGQDQIKPCSYADPGSHTTVVLFGDSHAGHWFDALRWISKQRHWRLVVMTKEGCTAAEVTLDYGSDNVCPEWREKAKARIASLHPALVIVSWARWMQPWASEKAGVPTGYGGPWQDGVAAIFQFLRRSAKQVIFISDTPYPQHSAPDCVAGHLSDVRSCARQRSDSTVLPAIKAAELRIAKQEHVSSIDPISWFCTPKVCPVIVGNILVYHDKSHMTPQWSRFIAPVLGDAIPTIT